MTSAVERFKAKCQFMPGSGCVIWRGATSHRHSGRERSPSFWYQGKRWPARRWAAIHIHGLKVDDSVNVGQGCGEPLCVQHVEVKPCDSRNLERQAYLLEQIGVWEPEPLVERPRPSHGGPPVHVMPEWLR